MIEAAIGSRSGDVRRRVAAGKPHGPSKVSPELVFGEDDVASPPARAHMKQDDL